MPSFIVLFGLNFILIIYQKQLKLLPLDVVSVMETIDTRDIKDEIRAPQFFNYLICNFIFIFQLCCFRLTKKQNARITILLRDYNTHQSIASVCLD